MLQELKIKFSNFLLSLSDAMDIANSAIALHQMRTAFIAWKLGLVAGLSEESIERLYLAALLHDIGALSLEEKIQMLIDFENTNPNIHCLLGEALLEQSPLLRKSAKIVRHHHTYWKDWKESIDNPLVLESQIVCLSDEIERSISRNVYILHQVNKLIGRMVSISGKKIHKDVVDIFMQVSKYEDFWLDLTSPRLYSLLLHCGPFRNVEIERENISTIASIFRHVVDFKSRFTATHSTGVAECGVILAQYCGFTNREIEEIKIAGFFHDLGKLAIPNSILEKQDTLSKEEFDIIKQHPYFTYTVLNSIGGLNNIAEWAAFHHEKLDGSGYPFHIKSDRISLGSRILAVSDIFTALSEDRPYRKGLDSKEVKEILKTKVKENSLDKRIVSFLLENYKEIEQKVKEKQQESIEFFEKKFFLLKK